MRKFILTSFILATAAAASTTPTAAQTTGGIITPFIGVTTNTPTDENRTVYGGSFGVTGRIVGVELDLGYAPNFFEDEDDFGELDSNGNVTTVMGNLLVGVPLGKVRPYGTVGLGLMRADLGLLDFFDDLSRNDLGVNYGGGVMVFVSDRIAVRGDLRQFRSLDNTDLDDDFPEPRDFRLGDFKFWRATAGVTFRF
ncbi:MAG: porin family protein [Acidobacteria bacterium]|nr:porin family protein [Acidobacteriota bacterium]